MKKGIVFFLSVCLVLVLPMNASAVREYPVTFNDACDIPTSSKVKIESDSTGYFINMPEQAWSNIQVPYQANLKLRPVKIIGSEKKIVFAGGNVISTKTYAREEIGVNASVISAFLKEITATTTIAGHEVPTALLTGGFAAGGTALWDAFTNRGTVVLEAYPSARVLEESDENGLYVPHGQFRVTFKSTVTLDGVVTIAWGYPPDNMVKNILEYNTGWYEVPGGCRFLIDDWAGYESFMNDAADGLPGVPVDEPTAGGQIPGDSGKTSTSPCDTLLKENIFLWVGCSVADAGFQFINAILDWFLDGL